jgi:dephospho-CoA kinase
MLGLTGGIASGKSSVSATLRSLGAEIIDADAVYHELVAPRDGAPSPVAAQIAARFGDVLKPDGALDRAALGARVFGSPEELTALGRITHPAVAGEVAQRVMSLEARGIAEVVYDVPLLYERGLERGMDAVIVVWVSHAVQVQRLMARDGIDAAAAERKVASQMSLDEKRGRADHVVDNTGTPEETAAQVRRIWAALHGGSAG